MRQTGTPSACARISQRQMSTIERARPITPSSSIASVARRRSASRLAKIEGILAEKSRREEIGDCNVDRRSARVAEAVGDEAAARGDPNRGVFARMTTKLPKDSGVRQRDAARPGLDPIDDRVMESVSNSPSKGASGRLRRANNLLATRRISAELVRPLCKLAAGTMHFKLQVAFGEVC